MPSTAWQQPFVNLCKHYGAGEWTKCSKEGEVSKIMDRTVKSSIFKIIGPIPSANYIQFPKPKGNPLNLIGHYLYVLFKPIDGKYFSIHLDVVTSDSIVIRISLSNIFKEFKSTSTWLQFPVFANPVQGSVDEATTLASNIPDNCLGGSPKSSRWTLLCLNMQYVLSVYLNKQFSHLKSIRLCSSMFLKNVFTSTTKYEPGLDISKARKTGLLASGVVPLPREMSFPLERHETWATKYDHILFPNIENKGLQLENAMPGRSSSKSISKSKSKGKAMVVKEENKERKTSNAQRSRVALAETVQRKLTENKKVASIRLPEVGLETPVTDDSLEISRKPSPDPKKIQQKKPSYHIYANKKPNKFKGKENQPIPITKGKEKQSSRRKVLNVDPILKLSQIIGFDGSTSTKVFWTKDGGNVVYPSHGCIVKYDVTTGRQQFMIGHNEEVTSLCLCETDNNILFSAQRGQNSIIRTWKVQSLKCINIFQTNIADIHCMSVSPNDEFLCVVGLDYHQKQVLAVWDVSAVVKGGAASLIAKVHTELRADTITCVKFIPNDNNRLMTCGKSNMRVWRLKPKQLKSCAIELGQYLDVVFTDMAFERRKKLVEDPTDFKIFVSSSVGKLFVVTYKSLTVTKVFDLSQGKQLSLNCIALSDNYCAVGCSDGYLRVWPISFQSVYLEAEHEGAVKIVSISEDGSKILAGTDMGNLGTIDILQKSYSTITRSHLSPIISTSLNPVHQQIASISEDRTIKLWDLDTFQQVYDFQSPNEALTSVSCHPNSPELACGFVTGAVRIFSLSTTTLKKELLQHPDTILSTAYSPNGQYLYSAGGDGALIQYNVSDDYDVLKMAENLVCKEPELPSYVLAIDSLGNRGAVIGASSYLITVFSAKTLDELLVIDISCTFKETNQKTTKSSKKNSKTLMDKPIGLIFSPSITGSELLVITMDSRLLKFNSKSGQILTEISNIHKGTPTSFCCCPRGYFIATAGDHCIKVWDYKMEESQVFIGHCSDVSSLAFTNDCRKLISSGEMIAVWDFIPFFKQDNSVNDREVSSQAFPEIQEHSPPGPPPLETSMLPREDQPMPRQPPQLIEQYSNAPPRSVPKPSTMTLLDESQHLENISQLEDDLIDFVIEETDRKRENQEEDSDCEILCYNNVDKEQKSLHRSARLQHSAPKVLSHFQELKKRSELANKRYAAPTHQAGMRLTEIIGANGNARRNVIWEPDSGLFIYTEGCHLVSEDLANGRQEVFYNAVEEISTIALQYDGKFVAVGCAYNPMTKFGPIVIWDLANKRIEKTLEHHNCSIIGLQFSRDDRFLLSVSDYRECSITIWACQDYTVVCQATTDYPIHAAIWHPYNANEIITVGRNATLLFWYLNDENYQEMKLEVSPAEFPKEVFRPGDENHDVTSLACSGKDQLLTGTTNGVICVWSIADRRCFMHWQADNTEICALSGSCGHVLTGSASKNIRLWKLPNIESILTQADSSKSQKGVVMEREQTLDAPITSLVFDENLEMGLASTTNGSIWYINWSETEAECVRIISGHQTKINSLVSCVGNDEFVATACADGSLKLWAMDSRDQAAQFLVLGQECTCVTFCAEHVDNKNTKELLEYNQVVHPLKRYEEQPSQCLAGYQDGTVRMFDFGQMKMLLKTKPHSCRVTSIAASFDGRVGISGSDDGLLVISSLTTGMTVRVFNDHRGGALCRITQQQTQNSLSSSLWLASSSDCRISVWRSDWSKDICELNDWITFVRPSYSSDQGADNEAIPCLAVFSPSNSDLLVYTGYTVQKEISFYSMIKRKVVKTVSVSNWILALDISPCGNLLAAGTQDRLVKLIDCESGTFQDFVGHYEAVQHAKFVKSGKALVSSAHSELLKWDVLI